MFSSVLRTRAPALLLPITLVAVIALGGWGAGAAVIRAQLTGSPDAAAPAVSVFPIPGTKFNLPETQISFRGADPNQLGSVTVVGSVSGAHDGTLKPDSDGQGASFLPAAPFHPGETVTVFTNLNVVGGNSGRFSFSIAQPGNTFPATGLGVTGYSSSGVLGFHSAPGLHPAAVRLRNAGAPALGDIFLAPEHGPLQVGPEIIDAHGNLVWFHPAPIGQKRLTTDLRVQNLYGQPVLTWWQGSLNHGSGRGEDVILDRHYRQIATVHAGNGLAADLHDFLLEPNGDAYLVAASPVHVSGSVRPIVDSVIQEIDIKTGLVLFEWHALDHVPLSESFRSSLHEPGHIIDPYHLNSVSVAPDNNLVVSMRNTSTVYEIDHQTGDILWRFGGTDSTFKLGAGTAIWCQHDAIAHADGTLTIFDNGGGPPRRQPVTHGLRISLNLAAKTATLVRAIGHSPPLATPDQGNMQALPDGETFLGFGSSGYFSEFNGVGQQDLDAQWVAYNSSYRVYRFPWSGTPATPPGIAATPSGSRASVYASWNGATGVARWRVLGGSSRENLRPLATVTKTGFETHATVTRTAYVAVEAVGFAGNTLHRSRVVHLG